MALGPERDGRQTYEEGEQDIDEQITGASGDDGRSCRREDDGDDDEDDVRAFDHCGKVE